MLIDLAVTQRHYNIFKTPSRQNQHKKSTKVTFAEVNIAC
ncbi:hypothetical protein P244_4453 [Klebsiella pneumoniae HK787]|nr:hypothetical protein P244_4453 [Klebsiella pneumoniae HK787]